jgi:hypothetical protein
METDRTKEKRALFQVLQLNCVFNRLDIPMKQAQSILHSISWH